MTKNKLGNMDDKPRKSKNYLKAVKTKKTKAN